MTADSRDGWGQPMCPTCGLERNAHGQPGDLCPRPAEVGAEPTDVQREHGPSKCVSVDDANRVLAQERAGVQALTADAEKRAAAGALRALRARLAACEDAPIDAALEGLDFTLRVLAHQADALDPT